MSDKVRIGKIAIMLKVRKPLARAEQEQSKRRARAEQGKRKRMSMCKSKERATEEQEKTWAKLLPMLCSCSRSALAPPLLWLFCCSFVALSTLLFPKKMKERTRDAQCNYTCIHIICSPLRTFCTTGKYFPFCGSTQQVIGRAYLVNECQFPSFDGKVDSSSSWECPILFL